jgi:hypothetical protein
VSVDLQAAAADYLAHRRALGYRLVDHDWLLASFLDSLDAAGTSTVRLSNAHPPAGPGPDRSTPHHTQPLHRPRQAAGLPREPVVMPNQHSRAPPPATTVTPTSA